MAGSWLVAQKVTRKGGCRVEEAQRLNSERALAPQVLKAFLYQCFLHKHPASQGPPAGQGSCSQAISGWMAPRVSESQWLLRSGQPQVAEKAQRLKVTGKIPG